MSTATEKAPNPHYSEFLSAHSRTREDFAAEAAESPDSACSLLSRWAESQIEDYGAECAGAEWAARQIAKLKRVTGEEKSLMVSAPPVENRRESIPESVKPKAEKPREEKFVEVETEVMEDEPDSIPEPPATGDLGFRAISQRLAVTCQKVVTKDLASIVHDALQGKVALPPVFLSGFAGLGKTFAVDLISGLLPDFNLIAPTPGFTLASFKAALVDNCHMPFIFFIDELHAIKSDVGDFLKCITETNGKVKDFNVSISKNEYTITIDPRIHWFIGASNEPIKDSALVGQSGRFRDLQFMPYDDKGKGAIMTAMLPQYLPGVQLSTQTKAIIARNTRPFARSIKMMLERLRTEAKCGADINSEDGIKKAIGAAGYYPGGWRKEHIDVLTFLAANDNGRQVQEIAQGPMRGASSGQATSLLSELMQGDLIVTLGNGRKAATATAVKLLKGLESKAKK